MLGKLEKILKVKMEKNTLITALHHAQQPQNVRKLTPRCNQDERCCL
jgi:hypothetical protein